MRTPLESIKIRLKREGEKSLGFFNSISPADWGQQVYTSGGKWNVQQILCHFVSTELAFEKLIQNILLGGSGAPRDFDIDRFNESEASKLEGEPIDDLLTQFEAARARTCQLVGALQEADLGRIGFHPWFGEIEIEKMLKLIYRHNMIHLRDVRKALSTKQPVPHLEIELPSTRPP